MKFRQKKELLKQLKTLPDFRKHDGKIIYPLSNVLFMSILAMLKGKQTLDEMHTWMVMSANNPVLCKLLGFEEIIDTPSRSTLHAILINTDNDAFELLFRTYFKKYAKGRHVAVDGKWMRGSDIHGQYIDESHKSLLNIFDKEQKVVLGHRLIGTDKKSEIPAFEEELSKTTELFCEEKQIFSFDALMTQVDILNTINEKGSFYIAKVKGNQEALLEKVKACIEDFNSPTTLYDTRDDYKKEGNHYVERLCEVYQSASSYQVLFDPRFKNIQSIIKITKTVSSSKEGTLEVIEQYFIANFQSDAREFAAIVLSHWGVETYHYHLDMLMGEDNHIAYVNPFVFSILRSFALNLYQLYFNAHKGEKVTINGIKINKPVTMARIQDFCENNTDFALELMEISA